MNRRLLIIFMIIIISFTFSNVFAYEHKNETTGYTILIEDDAELLSEEEVSLLAEDMKPISEFGNIIFKSVAINSSYSTSNFAKEYYYNKFGNESGTVFLIDMDNREIYIYSDGSNYKVVTSGKATSITDNSYRYASDGNYYLCAKKSFEQIVALLNGYKISEPMRHTSNVFIALTIGFFICFIKVLSNSRIKSASCNEIVKHCNVDFNVGIVTGVKTGQTRVYSPQSSGSSGGGHYGGGGGGGHSSGGGGGHRF